jgi:hypothetical protein
MVATHFGKKPIRKHSAEAASSLEVASRPLQMASLAWDNSPVKAQPAPGANSEKLSGLVERVTFFNEESGFCVLRVKAPGHRELVTVVGSSPSVCAGEWLTAEGTWVRDKEHGLQLKAAVLRTVPPTTAEGIERYLGSGMVKGIGPISAKRLVAGFGTKILSVIEHSGPEVRPAFISLVSQLAPDEAVLLKEIAFQSNEYTSWQMGVGTIPITQRQPAIDERNREHVRKLTESLPVIDRESEQDRSTRMRTCARILEALGLVSRDTVIPLLTGLGLTLLNACTPPSPKTDS